MSLLSGVLVIMLLVPTLVSYAANPTLTPFGGRSLKATVCTCTMGCILYYVGPPRVAAVMYCPWSIQHEFGNLYPSAWQLGLHYSAAQLTCRIYVYEDCVDEGGGYLQFRDGDSLY